MFYVPQITQFNEDFTEIKQTDKNFLKGYTALAQSQLDLIPRFNADKRAAFLSAHSMIISRTIKATTTQNPGPNDYLYCKLATAISIEHADEILQAILTKEKRVTVVRGAVEVQKAQDRLGSFLDSLQSPTPEFSIKPHTPDWDLKIKTYIKRDKTERYHQPNIYGVDWTCGCGKYFGYTRDDDLPRMTEKEADTIAWDAFIQHKMTNDIDEAPLLDKLWDECFPVEAKKSRKIPVVNPILAMIDTSPSRITFLIGFWVGILIVIFMSLMWGF